MIRDHACEQYVVVLVGSAFALHFYKAPFERVHDSNHLSHRGRGITDMFSALSLEGKILHLIEEIPRTNLMLVDDVGKVSHAARVEICRIEDKCVLFFFWCALLPAFVHASVERPDTGNNASNNTGFFAISLTLMVRFAISGVSIRVYADFFIDWVMRLLTDVQELTINILILIMDNEESFIARSEP